MLCYTTAESNPECESAADCDAGEQCVDSYWAPCPYFFTDEFELGHCTETKFIACVAKHSGCACIPDCADGYSVTVYYPEDAGVFPSDINPPPELMEVAVAKYECGVCSCMETWAIKDADVWMDEELGGPENFCAFLLAIDEACGSCLVAWEGGCC